VITSPRSVKKPIFRIFKEGLINWGRWGKYLLQKPLSSVSHFIAKVFHKNKMAAVLVSVILALIIFVIAGGYFLPTASFFRKVYAFEKNPDATLAISQKSGSGLVSGFPTLII
jgi:cytoskeletal protein RodZ